MICRECRKKKKKSRIYFTQEVIPGKTEKYFDEYGKLHYHNLSISIFRFECTNGHKWEKRVRNKCPVCGYKFFEKEDKEEWARIKKEMEKK